MFGLNVCIDGFPSGARYNAVLGNVNITLREMYFTSTAEGIRITPAGFPYT